MDWQSLTTVLIGLLAAAYLMRRWWPGLKGLFGAPPPPNTATASCATVAPGASAACQSGCGQCGQGAASPSKDHRIHIVRRPQD